MGMPLVKGKHGVSLSFATNFLGPFLLTTELLPILKKTATRYPGVRIVNISSRIHELLPNGIRFSSLEDFNQPLDAENNRESKRLRYGLSKLAMIFFTKELQRRARVDDTPILYTSMHPGGVKTDGVTRWFGDEYSYRLKDLLTPLDRALTSLFAAAYPVPWTEKEKYGGAYLTPFGVVTETTEDSRNMGLAAESWDTSELVLNNILESSS